MENKIIYWTTKDGQKIDIMSMDVNHLRNVLKMIVNNSNKNKDKIEKEAYWKKQNDTLFIQFK